MEKRNLADLKIPGSVEFSELLAKSAWHGEWHLNQSVSTILSFPAAMTVADDYGAGKVHDTIVGHAYVQLGCDIGQDFGTIFLGFNKLKGYPAAQKMLWHYFTGKGIEVLVNTREVFEKDSKLNSFVFDTIEKDLKRGRSSGSVNVSQNRYGNHEWQMAFGSINVPWKKITNYIEISITDVYKWHPKEFRVTECVHQAMERAKKYGAMDFKYEGTKMLIKLDK